MPGLADRGAPQRSRCLIFVTGPTNALDVAGSASTFNSRKWSCTTGDPGAIPSGLLCASASFRIQTDYYDVWTFNGPTWSESGFVSSPADDHPQAGSCLTTTLCQLTDDYGYVSTGK